MAAVKYRWKITGDGMYFQPFWVEAEDHLQAGAIASDILAGGSKPISTNWEGESRYQRHYRTVEKHIKSIVRES